ncbi:hypothetical protein VOLCADRAFT_96078 [Volvox carteri f. nagariensis]|uniref:Uncharacterized protein n=1 Tax=Volvox carteri f. nagariensis TaxID=3068 RepID=D8U955_VOLCA|nr:uncharacterized protein VOLCADRAFT_96078 [Volvox carteri f. nagariensis]EFJ43750.1 hypothetical protein VOLCADRAFT_96078 [Volvox carteri f. nagariensis]|eukprot:XP_002955231.1 hypothetical protein VOLCADRAFT_96078 [Volvox carteri f. nagariensis]
MVQLHPPGSGFNGPWWNGSVVVVVAVAALVMVVIAELAVVMEAAVVAVVVAVVVVTVVVMVTVEVTVVVVEVMVVIVGVKALVAVVVVVDLEVETAGCDSRYGLSVYIIPSLKPRHQSAVSLFNYLALSCKTLQESSPVQTSHVIVCTSVAV